ncbi:MAG: Ig domain-containing protein, partial [Bacteroidaceae bacterium]|nr:Ig domain-containing protein [Bacteroidaceae bacterium]
MKLLKRISIFVSLVLACVMAKAADYEIKAADISVVEGGTTTLAIELKNAGEVVGFQCDISLPEGVKLSGEMTMSRHQEGVHILVKKEQSDGSMRVLVYSNPNTPFTGNEGVVLNVPLSVEASIGSYSIGLKNPVITAPGAVAHYADASTVTLNVLPIEATAVTLSKTEMELLIGAKEQLTATVSPDNATNKTVVWTSSDNNIATVDENGNVTAVAIGSATITASCG